MTLSSAAPDNAVADLQAQGCVLCAAERYREAIARFDQAIALDRHNSRTWNYRGNALSALHRHAEALNCYDKAVSLDANYHPAWFNRGLLLVEMQAYGSAIAAFDQAIALYPDPCYLHARADISLKQKLVAFL